MPPAPPGDTRDHRVYASEIKFVVPRDTGDALAAWARTRLAADPHGAGPDGDRYDTATVYLDTVTFDVFHRRGSQGRAKYRVRRYGPANVAFVERKLRTRRLLAKRRTRVPVEQLAGLLAPGTTTACLAPWFTRRVAARGLGPVCLVTYQRTARVMATPAGLARLTVDTSLAAAPADGLTFGAAEPAAVLPGLAIVEFKFREVMPAAFRDAVERFRLEPAAVSKYRSAVAALGLPHA